MKFFLMVLFTFTSLLAEYCDSKHEILLKKWNMQSNSLIQSISKYSCSKPVYYGTMVAFTEPKLNAFKSKKELLEIIDILNENDCNTLNDNFGLSDVYDNEGHCYIFDAKLIQRIDRYTGLVLRNKKYTNEKEHVFYVTFQESWSEEDSKMGIIKGEGNFKYTTVNGYDKNVQKGKILFFK